MLEAPDTDLPNDVAALRALVLDGRKNLAAQAAENEVLRREVFHRDSLIEKLKIQLARLQRMQFGRSSEKLDREIEQLELMIEELETPLPTTVAYAQAQTRQAPSPRREFSPTLPREDVVYPADERCPACAGALRPAGEDVSEQLEFVPEHWKVIRHVRPKFSCGACETLVQAKAPVRPIAGGMAGPHLLAHVLVSKYCDHLPLYRQSEIYARAGVDLSRSTLADWVGHCSALLDPIAQRIGEYALSGEKLHADDTPVDVLTPGLGKTRTGRLWTYVRDDRDAGSTAPAAVRFLFTPDRKGLHPKQHLATFSGTLQADAYTGFHHLYGDRIQEAACWAHVRRKFFDIFEANKAPIAEEALKRIAGLYAVENEIRGQSPEIRCRARQARAGPQLEAMKQWLTATLQTVSKKSSIADAIRYALPRWPALVRYRDDGNLEIDNNIAERALRSIAIGRRNYLFFGSDAGGERAANIYTLIGTAKLNGINPEAYLRHVIDRIAHQPADRLDELLPWNFKNS